MSKKEIKKDLINRIRTIKGHLGGIEKMIEEGKSCEQILIQINAVKAAMNKIGMAIIENYTEECIMDAINSPENLQKKVRDIIESLVKFSR
ncbi:hypothetical protein BBF96_13535 [Anoxybacter fermentans]|uniref:Transcriptional regulator n=1 Tax=Anoxybacter fermentans TaxID=1323375 RepID=A0A3Q9HRU3_9FIRM|nr:metal-sensitive transcriptional regulator [Anoxybacter fermentans]AZR74323.1 hypothetical protein BBF96_13535 [Anoxybacter fermentans]